MTSSIVKASEVQVGDRITEVDTPEGPFYTVTKVNRASLVVGDEYPMRVPIGPTHIVRVAV